MWFVPVSGSISLAKSAIQKGKATDNKSEADGNIYTAQDENSIWTMMSQVLEVLK